MHVETALAFGHPVDRNLKRYAALRFRDLDGAGGTGSISGRSSGGSCGGSFGRLTKAVFSHKTTSSLDLRIKSCDLVHDAHGVLVAFIVC
jgi:hypothetical protein